MDTELKLRSRDKMFLLGCLVAGSLALVVGIQLFPKVNPEATIQFDLDRSEARVEAEAFLAAVDLDVTGHRHASAFVFDREARVYLERTLGLESFNEVVTGPVRLWRWGQRWYRPLEKEEIVVEVATTGSVVRFEHLLEEEATGARLDPEAARDLAESFALDHFGLDTGRLEFLDVQTQERPGRIDHTFVWKDPQLAFDGGSYRHEIRVHGEELGAYKQYVKVPESWSRDYGALRSKNQTTGAVAGTLTILLALSACIVLFRRIRMRDIRWKTAAWFGGIGFVLIFLYQINSLPMRMYHYPTLESFSGFLISTLLGYLVNSVTMSLFIFILTAAGESLYREAFPNKVSLTRWFTPGGFRTRRFLLSSVLGVTLAPVFFLYQEVFYLVSQKMGAWAPADVPYDNLLNTAFPWIFILLAGFQPAVTEEFLSRMFAIPMLKKLTRVTWLAVLIPALIWGFAHAGYPQQPFYIRGIEVGIVGIFMGVLMIRYNILAPLYWHYLVDALYSSVLLFRSGNSYYIVSAAVAASLILLPVIYAVVCYLKRGRFADPAEMLNGAEPKPSPLSEYQVPEVLPEAPPAWNPQRRLVLAGIGLVCMIAVFLPGETADSPAHRTLSKTDAVAAAESILETMGEDPRSYESATIGSQSYDRLWARYILKEAGQDGLRAAIDRYHADFRWKVRFYRPGDPREIKLEVDGVTGRLLMLDRHIAEEDTLPSVDSAEGERIAGEFLAARGMDASALELKESSSENRPNRVDQMFVWEAPEGDSRNLGEARHRVELTIQGAEIGAYDRYLKLPEAWERDRRERTAGTALRLANLVLVGGVLIGLAFLILMQGHRVGLTRWKRSLIAAAPFGVLLLIAWLNRWPQMVVTEYPTTWAWNTFVVWTAAVIGLSSVFLFLLLSAVVAMITTHFPQSWGLRNGSYRRAITPDALVATLLCLGVGLVNAKLVAWTGGWVSNIGMPPEVASTKALTGNVPWLSLVTTTFVKSMWILCVVVGVLGVARFRNMNRGLTGLFVLLGLVALVPLSTRGFAEFAVAFVEIAFDVGIAFALVRWVLRDNVLAYPLAIFVLLSTHAVSPYLVSEGAYFRTQGWVALVILALPVIWLVSGLLRRSPEPVRLSPTAGLTTD